MVRQYIGARYTPRFIGTFDVTQAYEALDVVDNGAGTTYIARVPVPPSTPLTNTDYWLVYGSSSGAILDLQTRVGSLESDVPVIQSSILRMGGEISDLDNDVTALDTRLDDVNSDLQTYKAAPIPFNKIGFNMHRFHNVICVGDSWNGTDGWGEILQSMGFSDGTIQIEGHGGTGFQTGTPTFKTAILNLTPLVDADNVDCVIIIGGTNDQTDFPNLPTAIGDCVATARSKFPNAKIFVGFNLHYVVGFGAMGATEIEGSRAVIANGGYPLTGLSFNQRFCRADWLSDNWHLNDYRYFAEMIYSGIYCGNIDVPRTMASVALGYTNSYISEVYAQYQNGYGMLRIAFKPNLSIASLANIIPVNDIPLLNLYGNIHKTIKSSATDANFLDVATSEGLFDCYMASSTGLLSASVGLISHHGQIIS